MSQPMIAKQAAPTEVAAAKVSTAQQSKLQTLGTFVGDCFSRLFAEARVIARMKMFAFAGLLTFLGFGFVLKVAGFNAATGTFGPVEFILASPGLAQTVGGVVALFFVVSANISCRRKRQEYERELLTLAADPSTPDAVRNAILQKLQGK